jgi:protein-S-isoprenylcysteine O-methyltransferase Ste14
MQMLTGVFQSLATLLTGLVYYMSDFWLMRHYDHGRPTQGSGRSWRYTGFMIAFWTVMVLQPILLPAVGLGIRGGWGLVLQGFGVASICGGLVLHWWSRVHLKHFYVEDVQFQDGQYLVDTGPYRRIRHPAFTSFFLIAAGLLLVNPAATTLFLVVYVMIDFSQAARREEELLTARLPEYADYMERSGRFWPKWR